MNCRYRATILLLLFSLAVATASVAQSISPDTSQYDSVTSIYGELAAEHLDSTAETKQAVIAKSVIYNSAIPDTDQWQRIVSDDAYSYRDKREFVPEPEEKDVEKPSTFLHLIETLTRFLQSGTGKLLLWISLLLIIGYVEYRLISGQGGSLFGKKAYAGAEDVTSNVTEQDLLSSNWDKQLSSALAAGDMRLAIRFSYMRLLQIMQERGIIAYRADKTNSQYYRELTDPTLRQAFREISRHYEYAWYGNYLPTLAGMEQYMQQYDSIKKLLA